jgi:hypothetical protein
MANQHYEIITHPTMHIKGKLYVVEAWNLSLEEFLNKNAGKQIYILDSSITTNAIRAIVI